ncbi:NAD(P)-binding domain-containing protein, partial [Pseudomonas aeruginosa]|nr:NAD(P)-binding domain-containing protein [Pseudomonas aeruginosa]
EVVAVLGGGNGAHALAADLTNRGYLVNLYEMPRFKKNMTKVFETKTVSSIGVIEGIFEMNMVTDDIEEAIKDVKYIVILTPAFAHADYAKLLKGKVTSDQVIVSIP